MTVEEFAKLAVLSGLMTSEKEAAMRAGSSPESVVRYARYLVAHGCLTEWQCRGLRAGKHKGFFLDNYKILRHSDDGLDYSRYFAEDTTTGATVLLRVFPPRPGIRRYVVDPPDEASPNSN
jgi:hypothetical protein